MRRNGKSVEFSILVRRFFSDYLLNQKNVSPETVLSYRDTFRILLVFFRERKNRDALSLRVEDLDAENILAYLDYLEKERGNSVRTRNIRLAAIRSFLKFVAAVNSPEYLAQTQRVIAIPFKRSDRMLVGFLSREALEAILKAPDERTWSGRRDRIMFAFMYNTGARVSETVALRVSAVSADGCRSVRIHGKGRKERSLPLWKSTSRQIRIWIRQNKFDDNDPLFPNGRGAPMSRSGVEKRLKEAAHKASLNSPELTLPAISPHILRHTTAMHMLQSGVPAEVIALWLGHESPSTTHMYVEADLEMKERALAKLDPRKTASLRFRAKDELIRFLESL